LFFSVAFSASSNWNEEKREAVNFATSEVIMDPKTAATLAVYHTLRDETLIHVDRMMDLMIFIPTIMVVLILVWQYDRVRFRLAIHTAAVFGAFSPFVFARQDLLIHRLAPVVKALEDQLGLMGWENHYKPLVAPLNQMLVSLDILAYVPIFVLFIYAGACSRTQFENRRTGYAFVAFCALAFGMGVASIYSVLQAAGALMQTVR
jgi:hypothetical protein